MEVTENKINSQDEDISKLSSKSDDQVKHELNRQESCFISSHSLKDYECYVPKYVKKRLIAEVQRGEKNFTGNEKLFAALLFADISGFTRLSSRLNAEELKHHINEYFSKMLDIVHSNDGDVVKFCGDAVLIMWTVPVNAHSNKKRSAVVKAALCALQLINECGNYCKPIQEKRNNDSIINAANLHTDVSTISLPHHRASFIAPEKADIELSLHCGIGCGDINCMIVGNHHRRELIITGDVLHEMGMAESQAGSNEVCVTAICYSYLKKYFYMIPASQKTSVDGKGETLSPLQHVDATILKDENESEFSPPTLSPSLSNVGNPAAHPNHTVAYILCGKLSESFKLFLLSKNLLTTFKHNNGGKGITSTSLKPSSSEDESILATEKSKFSTRNSMGPVKRLGMATKRFGRKSTMEANNGGNQEIIEENAILTEFRSSERGTSSPEHRKRSSLMTGSFHINALTDMSSKIMDSISSYIDFRGSNGMMGGTSFNSESNPNMEITTTVSNRNSVSISHSMHPLVTMDNERYQLPFDYDQGLGVREMKILFNACSDPVLYNMFPVIQVVQTKKEDISDAVEEVLPPIMNTLMRSFVHETALSAIDSNTYAMLSENREISTVFLMIKGLENDLQCGHSTRPQEFFLHLLKTTQACGGSVRQFVVDDKGCVAIVCFGLFGSSNANNALQAVRFAIQLHNVIHKQGVFFSAGVTYGNVYCGNVGSKERCEFCVMGSSVNLAARLMAACNKYNQTIMVDEEVHSLIHNKIQFQQMASIQAKGYEQPIAVYSPIAKPNALNLTGNPIGVSGSPSGHGVTRRSLRISIGNSCSDKRSIAAVSDFNNTSNTSVQVDPSMQFIRTIQELNESYQKSLLHTPSSPSATPKLKTIASARFAPVNTKITKISEMSVKFIPPEREEDITKVLAHLQINHMTSTLSPHASTKSLSTNSSKCSGSLGRGGSKQSSEMSFPPVPTTHPFSILVTGADGSGKTSFMQRLCYDLADTLPAESIIKYIDCNTVKPNNSPYALIREIIRMILQESEKRAKRERLENEFNTTAQFHHQQRSSVDGNITTASQSLSSTSSVTRMTMTESDVANIDRGGAFDSNTNVFRRLNSGSFQCNFRSSGMLKKRRRRRSSDGSIRMTKAIKSVQKPRRQTVHNCISAALLLERISPLHGMNIDGNRSNLISPAFTLLSRQFIKLKSIRDVVTFCTNENPGSFAFEEVAATIEVMEEWLHPDGATEDFYQSTTILDLLSASRREKVSLMEFLQSLSNSTITGTNGQLINSGDQSSYALYDLLFESILLLLFGLDPVTKQLGAQSYYGFGSLTILLDDLHRADSNSLKILSNVVARLEQAYTGKELSSTKGPHGCLISSWMIKDTDKGLQQGQYFYQQEQILSRTIQPFILTPPNNGKAKLQTLQHQNSNANHWHREMFLTWKSLSEDVTMTSLARASIKGLLHSFLGERRWEWLMKKTISAQSGGKVSPQILPMFGRRKAFVAELFQSIEESDGLPEEQDKQTSIGKEELRRASDVVVEEVFSMTLNGSPSLVYELLSSLRQCIDRGIFTSLPELPVMKQRKKKVFEWLDSLNGSELAILKASSVAGSSFNTSLLHRGLMSLDMEYCCAEMVMKSALLRLQRVGIIRRIGPSNTSTLVNISIAVPTSADVKQMPSQEHYEFCDDATRVAVYNLMLESQRAAVHGAIAKYYEELHPLTTSTTLLHNVYDHYMRSGSVDKMTEYNIQMMQLSTQQQQYLHALQFSTTLLSLISGVKEKVVLRSIQNHWEKLGVHLNPRAECGWVEKHWKMHSFQLAGGSRYHVPHQIASNSALRGNSIMNSLGLGIGRRRALLPSASRSNLSSEVTMTNCQRLSRQALTTLLDYAPPSPNAEVVSTRQHRGSSIVSSTNRRLTTLSWHTMAWTNRVAVDHAANGAAHIPMGIVSPLGGHQSPNMLKGDYSCKLATLYGKFLLHQQLETIAATQGVLRGNRRFSTRLPANNNSMTALLALKKQRDFSMAIFNIKRDNSISLPLFAYVLERSSYFYWCLGHCAKSEDCLALSLTCLRAHRLQLPEAQDQNQRSSRVLNTNLPPSSPSSPSQKASSPKSSSNTNLSNLELNEIEQLCQERLAFSLWMKGDLLACLALLTPAILPGEKDNVAAAASSSHLISLPNLSIYSCALRVSHCMSESISVSRMVLQKFLIALRSNNSGRDSPIFSHSTKTMMVFAMGFHYLCEGQLAKTSSAWRQVLQSAKDAQNKTMIVASMVLLLWTAFLQGDYLAIEDSLQEIQHLQQHTEQFEESISKTLWLELQLVQRGMACLQVCFKPTIVATSTWASNRVYQNHPGSKKDKVFRTSAAGAASSSASPSNLPASSISTVSPMTNNFFRGMLGHHEWVEKTIHWFQKTLIFKTSSYYNVEKTDERHLIQDMNRLLLIYLHGQHPLQASSVHDGLHQLGSAAIEEGASTSSSMPWSHKYKSNHTRFIQAKIQKLFFAFVQQHQQDASSSSTSSGLFNASNTSFASNGSNEDICFKTSPFQHTFAFMLLLSVSQYLYHQLMKHPKQRLLGGQCEMLVLWWHALAEFTSTLSTSSCHFEVLGPLHAVLLVQLELICVALEDVEGKEHPLLKCLHEHVCTRLKINLSSSTTSAAGQYLPTSCLPWLSVHCSASHPIRYQEDKDSKCILLYQRLMEYLEQDRLLWKGKMDAKVSSEGKEKQETPCGSEDHDDDSDTSSDEDNAASPDLPAFLSKQSEDSLDSIGDLYSHLLQYLDSSEGTQKAFPSKVSSKESAPHMSSFADWMTNWQLDKLRELYQSQQQALFHAPTK